MTNRLRAYTTLGVLATSMAACNGGLPPTTSAPHTHSSSAHGPHSGPFVASRDRPFGEQMTDARTRVHEGMAAAPTNGDPDSDFVSMMLPHHQGAVDMAKVLLVLGKDPEMGHRRLLR